MSQDRDCCSFAHALAVPCRLQIRICARHCRRSLAKSAPEEALREAREARGSPASDLFKGSRDHSGMLSRSVTSTQCKTLNVLQVGCGGKMCKGIPRVPVDGGMEP